MVSGLVFPLSITLIRMVPSTIGSNSLIQSQTWGSLSSLDDASGDAVNLLSESARLSRMFEEWMSPKSGVDALNSASECIEVPTRFLDD